MKKTLLFCLLLPALVVPASASNLELGDPNLSSDPDSPSRLAVSLKNVAAAIVGMQFDIVYSSGLASPGIPTLPEGSSHKIDVRLVSQGRYRVMVYSPTNKAFNSPYSVDLRFAFADEAPEGGPAMRLENLILATSDGVEIPASAMYGPIGSWRNEKFSDEVWNNKATGGDRGDADKDGLANIEEFYFTTDPRSSDSNASSVIGGALAPDGSGGKVLRLTWTARKAVGGVKPVIFGGIDPANLQEVIAEQVVDTSNPNFDKLKAEKSVKNGNAYFMEIRAQRE